MSQQKPLNPLVVNQLTKKYGDFTAVNNVSFEVRPGEIFGLLGPNGAGKTTIISTITTLEEPTSGGVEVFGHDVVADTRSAKFSLGVVPQEIVNHGFFNASEIMKIHSSYYGRWKNQERCDYLLDRLSLWEHRHKKVKHLSGGMKRRLMIAKALVHEPKLLLLDEPTAGVDIELRESLWQFVTELRDSGMSILLTTHYLGEAEELCHRVGILQNGNLRRIGDTKALIKEMTQKMVSIYFSSELAKIDNKYLISHEKDLAQFSLPTSVQIGELLDELQLDMKCVKDIEIKEGNLEDAFRNVLHERDSEQGAVL